MAGFDTFTTIHTILSLIWLAAGFPVAAGLIHSRTPAVWTIVFLVTGVLTCVTGFGFNAPFMPSHAVGILSLIALALAIVGLYLFHLAGAWRWIYAVSMLVAFYFNAFVTVVQAFRKIAFLNVLAPTQSEPPFAVAQLVVLAIFAYLIYAAVKNFRPAVTAAAVH